MDSGSLSDNPIYPEESQIGDQFLQLISVLFDPYAPKTVEVFTEIAELLDKHLGKQGVSQEGYDGGRSTPRSVL